MGDWQGKNKMGPTYSVGQELQTKDSDTGKWVKGVVKEVGDESILIQWEDIKDPTEYDISKVELKGNIFFED